MKIKTFKHGYRNGWEVNFFAGNFSLRVARHQLAFWKNHNPIVNLLF